MARFHFRGCGHLIVNNLHFIQRSYVVCTVLAGAVAQKELCVSSILRLALGWSQLTAAQAVAVLEWVCYHYSGLLFDASTTFLTLPAGHPLTQM